MVRAGRHLLTLVNDLLDASKLELGRTTLHMAAFDGVELVSEIVSSVRTIARQRGIAIVQQSNTTEVVMLMADRVRIGQVLYRTVHLHASSSRRPSSCRPRRSAIQIGWTRIFSFKGDEMAFCAAYGAGDYAPDLKHTPTQPPDPP